MPSTKTKPAPAAAPVQAPAPAPAPTPTPPATAQLSGVCGLAEIRPCPFNVRKHFDPQDLADLAGSIRTVGLKDPLLVRPFNSAGEQVSLGSKNWRQQTAFFQLCDGERRYRALQLIDPEAFDVEKVPVIVRNLTDDEARAVMLCSREQSRDLLPSERAVAYAESLKTKTAEQIAREVGSVGGKTATPALVRSIASITKLPAWALTAVDSGTLPRSTAELVAKIAGEESRKQAAYMVLIGIEYRSAVVWPDVIELTEKEVKTAEPLSYRDTGDMVKREFSIELRGAPFDRKSLDLLPAAGACEPCPNRAGNDPEAKSDGVRADVCLNPDCYRAKAAAYRTKEIAKATEKGVEHSELEDVGFPAPRGWARLTDEPWRTDLAGDFPIGHKRRDEKLKDLLGKVEVARWLAFDKSGKAVMLVKTAEARKALIDAKVLTKPEPRKKDKPAEKPKPSANGKPVSLVDEPTHREVMDRRALVAADRCRTMLLANAESLEAMSACGGPDTDAAYQALSFAARIIAADWCDVDTERTAAVRKYIPAASSHNRVKDVDAIRAAVEAMTPAEVVGFVFAMTAHVVLAEPATRPAFTKELYDYADTTEADCEAEARKQLAPEPADTKAEAAAPTSAPTSAPAPVVLLAEVDGFPELAFDACFNAGITSINTLLARLDAEQEPQVKEMPLRNRLVTYFVTKLKLKLKVAENAADAVDRQAGACRPEVEEAEQPREAFPPDFTGEYERRYANRENDCPADEHYRKVIAEWRERQKKGDTEPQWRKWAEFDLLLADGRKVTVIYHPDRLAGDGGDHFEFHGEAISSTGYRSHFEMFAGKKRPKITLEAYALKMAEELAALEKIDKEKRERREKKEAKKAGNAILNGTKPKPKKKASAAK